MKTLILYNFLFMVFLVIVSGCKNKPANVKNKSETIEKEADRDSITITQLKVRESSGDAILEMNKPEEFRMIPAGKTEFLYDITNFRLGASPSPTGFNNMAVYSSGSHITLVLNNTTPIANNSPTFEVNLKPGHYVALSFLTEPNYISVKSPDAYVLREFDVGRKSDEDLDLTGPNLFYHMPSGTYSGSDTKNILLDFYLVNCQLSASGFRVRATINNKTFIITDWRPYLIHGLPIGESIIKLELLDKNGHAVNSPFHSGTRKIHLYERQPA